VRLEVDLRAVHELDLPAGREARPLARVHEVPTSAADGRQVRDAVAAALAPWRNTERERPNLRIFYKFGLSSHTLFSSQAIS
jgi:hypothetical protein